MYARYLNAGSAATKGPKKALTADGGRRHRQEASVSLRKEKRQEGLQKRRNLMATAEEVASEAAPAAVKTPEVQVALLGDYCAGAFSRHAGQGMLAPRRHLASPRPRLRATQILLIVRHSPCFLPLTDQPQPRARATPRRS
jgi:hypothetical protein